jgi:succinate dehydrogenase/fumarate reductase cytochrome b subunit
MGLNRNVSLATALRYRGQGPMLTFVLHRIGGIGMAVFITIHILASFLGGEIGSFLNTVYEHRCFTSSSVCSRINGLRITIVDLFRSCWFISVRDLGGMGVFIPDLPAAVFVIIRTAVKAIWQRRN